MTVPDVVRDFLKRENIPSCTLLAAVSGGIDSTALLIAASGLQSSGYRIIAAHVNHHLRGEASDEDERFSAALATDLGLEWLRADGPVDPQSVRERGLEAAARMARYSALRAMKHSARADWIVTAHQLDDQSETILMRLLRGGPLRSLAGIPERTEDCLRPLLSVPRRDLELFLRTKNVSPRFDASNADLRYERNRVRHEIFPALQLVYPDLRETLVRLSADVRNQEQMMEPLVREATQRWCVRRKGETLFAVGCEPVARWMRERIFMDEVRRLSPSTRDLKAARLAVVAAGLETLPRTRITRDLEAVPSARGTWLRQVSRPKHEPFDVPITLDIPFEIPALSARGLLREVERIPSERHTGPATLSSQYFEVPGSVERPSFTITTRRPGQRFQPLGLRYQKKLNEFLIDRKIPQELRDQLPLLMCNGEVVWVAGVEISEKYKVPAKPGSLFEISIEYGHERTETKQDLQPR